METVQDMILRAWYSKRELMLTMVAAAGMWGMVLPTAGRRILSVPSCLRKGGKTWHRVFHAARTDSYCMSLTP